MRSYAIILLAFGAQAHVQELIENRGSESDKAVDDLAERLFERVLNTSPVYQADLDRATLGKTATFGTARGATPQLLAPYSSSSRVSSWPQSQFIPVGSASNWAGHGTQFRLDTPTPQFRLEPVKAVPNINAATQTPEAPAESEVYKIKEGLMPRERYIAANRFVVRDGAGPKFEARWANRKSRLATLDGFKYFTLMRRVPIEGVADSYDDDFSYVSFTIWEDKKAFNEWRTGDAFKEAHGGTSIGAFLTTMVSSLLVLKGPPSPFFWDGLMHQSVVPESVPETEGGWRVVEADGVQSLPTEAFIACNRFSVLPGQEKAFEERWANRDSQLKSCSGFVSFTMLRRDLKTKMHGSGDKAKPGDNYNYMSTTIWENKEAFLNWRKSQQFAKAHGGGPKQAGADAEKAPKPPPMWAGPPSPVFYEGVLVIANKDGS